MRSTCYFTSFVRCAIDFTYYFTMRVSNVHIYKMASSALDLAVQACKVAGFESAWGLSCNGWHIAADSGIQNTNVRARLATNEGEVRAMKLLGCDTLPGIILGDVLYVVNAWGQCEVEHLPSRTFTTYDLKLNCLTPYEIWVGSDGICIEVGPNAYALIREGYPLEMVSEPIGELAIDWHARMLAFDTDAE